MLYQKIQAYLEQAKGGFDHIPPKRKATLGQLAVYIQNNLEHNQQANLIYICTHNSRRSHMGQLWALAAAEYYGLSDISSFSGGTEATAFNPAAINALQQAGFDIVKTTNNVNPVYEVRYSQNGPAVSAFSKKYEEAPNPKKNFIAVMTCSDADEHCPFVAGAIARVVTAYSDPKLSDGTPEQEKVYKERCLQIATETLYTMSLVYSSFKPKEIV